VVVVVVVTTRINQNITFRNMKRTHG